MLPQRELKYLHLRSISRSTSLKDAGGVTLNVKYSFRGIRYLGRIHNDLKLWSWDIFTQLEVCPWGSGLCMRLLAVIY